MQKIFRELNLNIKMVDYLAVLEENLVSLLGKKIMDEVKWFINSDEVDKECKSNSTIAFKLGRAMERARGIEVLYVEALYMLFLTKDAYIKNCSLRRDYREFYSRWEKFEKLMEAANVWRIINLNY